MYTLLRSTGFQKELLIEGPSLVVSMVIAELFYKFHSFTFECVAFLATWCAVSCAVSLLRGAWTARHATATSTCGNGPTQASAEL